MTPRRAAAVVAGIVLTVGLLMAINPLTVDGANAKLDCGTALSPSYTEARQADMDLPFGFPALHRAACDEAVGEQRGLAFPILGVAGLALVFLWLTRDHETRQDAGTPAGQSPAA